MLRNSLLGPNLAHETKRCKLQQRDLYPIIQSTKTRMKTENRRRMDFMIES
jgi:hypothetical protein